MNINLKTFKYFALSLIFLVISNGVNAETNLADNPLFSTKGQTANVALALSVESPTAVGSAYTVGYNNKSEFLGYWDANKCYTYVVSTPQPYAAKFYNTGVNDSNTLVSYGTPDMHWSVIGLGAGTMDVVNNIYPSNNATSRSIGRSDALQDVDFIYQTTFNIPTGTDPKEVQVQFKLAFDDQIKDILVNGISTGINYPDIDISASVTTTLNYNNSNFVQGTNTIQIVVHNLTGQAGLRVDGATVTKGGIDGDYFSPVSLAAKNHVCNAGTTPYWSGNYLNWALTQTIDPFRMALSGGYRSVDRVGTTILEKAYASGQVGNVKQPLIANNKALIALSTPFQNLTNIRVKISGLGTKFYITPDSTINLDTYTTTGGKVIVGAPPAIPSANGVYELSARVKVCDPSLLENNCTKYSLSNYKPEGLIQKNSKKLNFAAFGYLKDDNKKRDGGVLRARMAALGPIKKLSDSSEVINLNPEWDADTGVFDVNPAKTDATDSGVTQSGVINYLNKFGLNSGSYKLNDPVSELYYAVTRYFKNQGNVAEYTSGVDATPAFKDGFPVITKWDDPIKNVCQANFIIGIGDTNAHADSNLPGATNRTGNEPALPTTVQNDTTVNVRTATNKIGELEKLGSGYDLLGDKNTPWCCGDGTSFMIAGLAYDNHTEDIRPNDFKPSLGQKTTKQTIETYWLDVLEGGDRKDGIPFVAVTGLRNQFWFAAKYGGFTVPTGYDPYATTAVAPLQSAWDNNNDGDPDNYFRANNPSLMINGLTKAFDDIVLKSGIGSSDRLSVSSTAIQSDDITVSTAYNADGWTGDVIGSKISFDANDTILRTEVWRAAAKLVPAQSSGRVIATSKCDSYAYSGDGTKVCTGTGVPFRSASDLLTVQTAALTATNNAAQDVIDFLRGDNSKEDNTNFRIRTKLLGDVANAKVVIVGAPKLGLSDVYNPGYSDFANANASRGKVAYVGANDGMLHAFNAAADSSGGNELFAYIPSFLFSGPNAKPVNDGLVALTKTPYIHHQYVDATPAVQDVNFGGGSSDWHTLLVGGLGKGGKGYYALDVTNPSSLTSEANLAAAVKWEFTDKDMGYSYGTPVIVKINNSSVGYNGWVVIVTSGYNNADKNGYFYVLNAKTGALIKKIQTYSSSPTSDAGLAIPNVWINDGTNYYADAAYAGDLLGGVWRLNLKDFTVTQFATLKNASGQAQPITTRVRISADKSSGNRYVLVGTGKLLDDSDVGNTQTQSVYAIIDGFGDEGGYFGGNTALPSGVSLPIVRANLNNNSISFASSGITNPAANTVGWYIDLTENYIVNVEMEVNTGTLYVAANKLVGSACESTNSSRRYTLTYGTGASASALAYIESKGLIFDITFYRNATDDPNSKVIAVAEGDDEFAKAVVTDCKNPEGCDRFPPGNPAFGFNFRQLNWRDLPTAD